RLRHTTLLTALPYHIVLITVCFFFTAPPTPEIYTLSLHDALPIYRGRADAVARRHRAQRRFVAAIGNPRQSCARRSSASGFQLQDRKSTRLNSSHDQISYAVFCLKKKNKQRKNRRIANDITI